MNIKDIKSSAKVHRVRRKVASKYLFDEWGISRTPSTLAKLAVIGGGPSFEKDGRFPLYTEKALDDFARKTLSPVVQSTAELVARKRSDG